MIFFGPHSSWSALFITSLIFLFPYNDLAFPLIQNATNPYSNYAVECKDDISWVDFATIPPTVSKLSKISI